MVTTRFEHFGKIELGQRLAERIDTPDRYIEFRAFSREGFPAVTALVSDLRDILLPLRDVSMPAFNEAKQFVGWYVGEMMRNHGHVIVRKSARVPGNVFTVGAVWSGRPEGEQPSEPQAAAPDGRVAMVA